VIAEVSSSVSTPGDDGVPSMLSQPAIKSGIDRSLDNGPETVLSGRSVAGSISSADQADTETENPSIFITVENVNPIPGCTQSRTQIVVVTYRGSEQDDTVDAVRRQCFSSGQDNRAAGAVADQVNPMLRKGRPVTTDLGRQSLALLEVIVMVNLVGHVSAVTERPGKCLDLHGRAGLGDGLHEVA